MLEYYDLTKEENQLREVRKYVKEYYEKNGKIDEQRIRYIIENLLERSSLHYNVYILNVIIPRVCKEMLEQRTDSIKQ